jgi:integrative and conjugative element protein (TIGR02256 family)
VQLLLPTRLLKRLERQLKRAGRREIGGVLMGEHVDGETFRLVDFTAQMSGGTRACFIRRPEEHRAELDKFFAKTAMDYARYNYLGEWHSHPSFAPVPSPTDCETMQDIATDPAVGVNFVVLLVVKLENKDHMALSASLFRNGLEPIDMPVAVEPPGKQTGIRSWFSALRRR